MQLRSLASLVAAILALGTPLVSAAAPALPPTSPIALPADYRIRAGDIVSVTVFGEATLSQPAVRVLQGGTIVLPLAGEVTVGGLTPPQASSAVARKLSKYLRQPDVAVAVAAVGPDDVYVLGNVKLPGKYTLDPQAHLMDAIAAAGGLGPVNGDLPDARVSVDGNVQSVSLEQMLHKGDLSLNAPIQNQMAIYIPAPATFDISVFGAVDHQGPVAMHDGDRLLVAIARAGASQSANADLNRVEVRHQVNGVVQTQVVNLYDIINKGQNEKDVVLTKDDVVYVPSGAPHHDNTGFFYFLTNLIRL